MPKPNSKSPFSHLKLNMDWYLPPFPYPERAQKSVIPSEFKKEGFTQTGPHTFNKSFNDIVELEVKTGRNKTYHWKFNRNKFLRMLTELRSIKSYVDEQAHKQIERRKMRLTDKSAEFVEAVKNTYISKSKFLEKYKDFVSAFSGHMQCEIVYFRRKVFCFDFCTNSADLNLYFEFISDFLYLFAVVKKSVPAKRFITPDEIKQAMIGYAAVLLCVQKIRRAYQENESIESLKKKYWMFSPENIEKITSDKGSGKGWKFGASSFAIEFAVYVCNTTEGNFKQILKKETAFYNEIKRRLEMEPNVEDFLAGSKSLHIDPKYPLKAEIIPAHDWLENFRMALIHFGDEEFLSYNPKGSPSLP